MHRFTQFPAIGDDGDADGAPLAVVACQIDARDLPSDVCALAWAALLRAFTTDETPVFLLNGSPVKADLSARAIHPATLDAASDHSQNHTAVVIQENISAQGSGHTRVSGALTWSVDPATLSGALHSTGNIHAPFLHELGKQLKQILQEQAVRFGKQFHLFPDELPALSISNPTPCTLPGPQLLHELALSGFNDSHNAIEFFAADGNIRCLSYDALDQLSTKLAAEIALASAASANGAPKTVVPVLLPQSVELYVSWLAILKSGAAFCPLNVDAPLDRIEFILQDVAASVVVTLSASASKVPQHEHLTVITVDGLENKKSDPTEPCRKNCSPSDIAYVMYTSGSTGRPKGVGISHSAATQSLLAHNGLIPPFKRFLQFASPTFDVSVFEVFFPLMRGATLIGSEREHMLLDISYVMTEMRVDAAELTPTVAGELLRTRSAAPYLQVLLTIGEMLTRHVVDEFGESASSTGILHGMYGPTEATIHCTAVTQFQTKSRVNLIGKPLKTVSAYIMPLQPEDASSVSELQPLPSGQIGELVVGGPQLADGYINRPEENAKAFVESPRYGRLYRTGDKARMLPTGAIECFGRISSGQVKLRGQRIELGEIEHVICRAPEVRSAIAIVNNGSLIVFVLVNDKGTTDDALRDICRQWLPRFMIPGEFVLVNQFPQLPSGKVDRKALEADFARHRAAVQAVSEQPFRDAVEEKIVSAVADVLRRRPSTTESLATAGLDSLAAIRLASHLLDAGLRLDVGTLLEADSVDGIWQRAKEVQASLPTEDTQAKLRRIRQLVMDAGTAKIEALELRPQVTEVEPCSHIQQAMVLETIRNQKAYCNWIELQFDASVGLTAARNAFIKLSERNDILRSGFVEIGLKDHLYAGFTWEMLDERLFERCDELAYDVSLNSDQDLLHPFRVQFKEDQEKLRVLIHIHHAIYDGWSWQLILKDLHSILLGEELARRPSYSIVTDFFIEYKMRESAVESSLFWRDLLQGSSLVPFPNFHGKMDALPGTEEETRLLDISMSKLNEVAHVLRVSRQTIFQAAFCYILASYQGRGDVVFGTVFSGRTLPIKGIEAVLGPCIRTLPIRMDLDKMQDVLDLLLAIQNMNRKSLEHGSLPLQDIKKASGIGLGRNLFDSAFVWQESIWSNEPQGSLFREVGAAEFLEFALLLELEPREDGVQAKATYQRSIIPQEQVKILLEQIDSVASLLINSPQIPLDEICKHLPQSALSIRNAIFDAKRELANVASGVENIASIDPGRTAVELMLSNVVTSAVLNTQNITYGQLNTRATCLAHYLLNAGGTQDDRIAVLLDKSLDSYVTVLAIAKVGAGFVPVVCHAAAQQIASILEATDSKLCITDSMKEHRHDLAALNPDTLIRIPSSLDEYHERSVPTTHDRSEIFFAKVASAGSAPTNHGVVSYCEFQRSINAFADAYPGSAGSRMLQAPSQAATDFIFETFFAWHTGMTVCSTSDELLRKHPSQVIRAMGVTHLHLTPTLAARIDPRDVPNVLSLFTFGEVLTAKVHRQWAGRGLHQGYATGGLTHVCTICPNIEPSTAIANIGTPVKNTSAMIAADREVFCLLPRGASGEICFGGDQVQVVHGIAALGDYATGRFLNHPSFGRIYRTGTFGRLLPDGSLILTQRHGWGKLHGQQAHLIEIDRALLVSEMVLDAVSMMFINTMSTQQQLVTFWVPTTSVLDVESPKKLGMAVDDLFKDLSIRLSPSMLPSLLIPLEEIPMTESMKTDRSKLRRKIEQMTADELKLFSHKRSAAQPEDSLTDLEKTIAAALAAVTGTDKHHIHRDTSFYSLGLDSLSAIAFSRKLQESGCGRLPVSAILRHKSVAQLAAAIPAITGAHQCPQSSSQRNPTVFNESFIRPVEDEFKVSGASARSIYPCTPLQEAMLATESSNGHSAYFNHLLLRVHTDVDALKSAWDQMLQRHDILRTCFRSTNNRYFAYAQVVLDRATLPWYCVETSSDALDRDIEKKKAYFEGRSPVNGELPYTLTLFRDSAIEQTYLLLSIHHALYDGEGVSQLLHELQLVLSDQELPQTTSFHRFIDYMLSVDSEASDTYWDRYLSDVPPTLLSMFDGSKDLEDASGSQQIHAQLEFPLDSFKQHCKDLSVAPLNVFHAAWARLISLRTGSADICFGNVFSCRTVPLDGADSIVGPCFNTLPMRIKFSSTATNGDIMTLAQKNNSDILPHQLSPLRRVQRRILGDGSRLFDTLIILQNRNMELDSHLWELLRDEGNMGFPLICEIIPDTTANKVQVCLHFHASRIARASAEKVCQDFLALVEHTIRYPSAQASDRRGVGSDIPQLFEQKKPQSATSVKFAMTKSHTSRPWTHQEEAVRDILCKFSDCDSDALSPEMTIFQLGLDSINAVQISATLRKIGYKISAGDLLEAASIDRIASFLSSSEKTNKEEAFDFSGFETQYLHSACEQLHISPKSVQSLRPCTPVQNGMLALFTHSRGDMYFNRMAVKFSVPLDRRLLKKAWSTVMAQHEMLRTGFVQLRNQQYPFAMITYHEDIELPWYEVSCSDLAESGVRKEEALDSLHRPPWSISVKIAETVTSMHFSALHAIYDAQSLASIFADVAAAYEGKDRPGPAPITETLGPILVASGQNSQSAQGFWQSLASEVHPCRFPDLHPIRTEKRQLLSTSIRCSQSRGVLEDACRDLSVTFQAAGQVTWARVLAAYTGEPNVVFGTVLSGRNLSSSAQDAVFPCLVTVPSPLRIEGTNLELMDRTLKRNTAVVKNQLTPLSQIQRWLGSDEPLFDTLFVYQKFSSTTKAPYDWEIVDEETNIDYPVSIELIPHSTELEVRINYRSDVVPEQQAMILLNQYDKLLEQTLLSPDSSCGDYSCVGNSLLSVTPAKDDAIPSPVSLLHQFVEVNARKIPQSTALEFASGDLGDRLRKKTWTYSELDESGNRITRLLQAKGAISGGKIAICFDKCPEASMAILGILKSGCAYVAIDPAAPVSRKQFIVEDSGSKLLLCSLEKKAELESLTGVHIQAVDEPGLLKEIPLGEPVLSRPINPDDICYCLYTSGTTGTPKGCEITHGNAVQAMLAFQRLFAGHWDEESRWLQFASFHFDVSVLEQYWSWSVGICVTSCPRDILFEDLPGTIQKLQITHIDLTPSLARLLHPDDVPSLCRGVFITGGEQLKQEILDEWGEHGVIYNGYGPTEVTIGCTMLPRVSARDKASNIGPQFDNVGSYVFCPGTSTPVLRGSIGELCVSGPLVGKGYLNRRELTAEKFQFLPEYEDRIYRTGDLVRVLCDGSFQFLGRMDDQVKLRGQRLEIGEINEVIKQSTPEVNEVATLVIRHPKQAKDQLVSFVTCDSAQPKSAVVEVGSSADYRTLLSTIKAACHTHLPAYMVPTHVIPMTRFPLSANNKADMKVLKSIYQGLSLDDIQRLTSMSANRAANSPQEQKIMSVLSDFVGPSSGAISSWSSIYELGLDSISVISFSRSLREAGLPQAQPSLIMKHPTITGMASALQTTAAPSVSPESLYRNAKQDIEAFAQKHFYSVTENIGTFDSAIVAPCTPLQEGIIYHFLSSSTPLYCSTFTFELEAFVNLEKLHMAWTEAQHKVQMLRTRFSPTPDGYAQVILKRDVLPWFCERVTSEDHIAQIRERKLEQWIAGLSGLSTNLWEVGVINSPTKSVMCLNIFHALYDGNSFGLLLDLVAEYYLDYSKPVDQTPDFLDVLHHGPLCKDPTAEAFWKEHLASCCNPPLVTLDHGDDTSIIQRIQIDTTRPIDHLKKFLNVTEQAVLHACWLLTLQEHYSFVPPLGIIVSGRTIDVPGIKEVIGPLFNTIPSNIHFQNLETWSGVAQRCHDYHVSTIPFQHTPLRDIVKWLGKSPDDRLFDSLFVFQRENAEGESLTKGIWRALNSEAQHEYSLAFEVVRHGNMSLTATLAAKSYVLSSEAAEQILATFVRLLSEFARNPSRELPQVNRAPPNGHIDVRDELSGSRNLETTSKHGDASEFEWTPQALTIRNVITALAGIECQSVGEDTSIFEVGLDSIDAIKLSSRLSKSGIKLPVSAIMRHRTVRGMTEQLASPSQPDHNGTHLLLGQMETSLKKFLEKEGAVPNDACRILPAAPIQEAMVAEMVASGYKHYYNHEVLQLEPHVDAASLQDAWRAVVKAHPILRTSFVEVWDPEIPTSYAQVVHGEDNFDFQTVHLHGESVDTVIGRQRSRATTDLAHRPLVTVTVVVNDNVRYFVLSIAHALYDGWSINLLHEDVAKCYVGESCERPPPDPILEQIVSSSGDRALRFWRATLSNFTPAPFPPTRHAGSGSEVHRAEAPLSVPLEQAEAFCKQHGITMQALLVSCWSLVLATYVKRLDVAFGLVLSGRNVAESEHMMFPTMNTVAVRIILHGTRLELVKYVQEALLEMSEHQHFPLRRARPDIGSRQLFDTLFIYQKRPFKDTNTRPKLYKSTGGASDVEYPVCAEVEGVGETLVCRVACRQTVMGNEDTPMLLSQMAHVLRSIIYEPAQQTVDFTEDGMSICGSHTFQDTLVHDAEVETLAEMPGQTEWSTIESRIRKTLSTVSGVPTDSIHKDATIFQLGLDSISAIKVATLLKKQSVKLAVSDMLKAGTIERMAQVANCHHAELTSAQRSNALRESLDGIDVNELLRSYDVDPQRVQKAFPATAGQSYFLSMHALNPGVFYPYFYYLASGTLDKELLNHAWARLIELTPILRTAFVPTRDPQRLPYIQIVLDSISNPVVWHCRSSGAEISAKLRPSLGSVPVALHAFQTTEGTALMLQIHHALYDAVSLPSMMARLSTLCNTTEASISLSDSVDISDLVAFQQAHSPVEVRRQFWQSYLGRSSIRKPPAALSGKLGAIQQYYRPGLVQNMSNVERVAKRRGLSVQAIFLALYARVHARDVTATDGIGNEGIRSQLTVGLYLANRSHAAEGLSELVAPTVNIVPLRLDDKISDSDESLFAAAQNIQDEISEISRVEHVSVSLVEIAAWTGVRISTCINFLRLPEWDECIDNALVFKAVQPVELERLRVPTDCAHDQVGKPGRTEIPSIPVPTIDLTSSLAAVQDIFQPTIDVEAAIRDDQLDVGLFAPKSRLADNQAHRIIEHIQQEMHRLVKAQSEILL